YYFRRKESIVAELLQQINRVPLAYAKQLKKEGDDADVQLFRLIRFDVRNVCQFPLEITEVHRFSRRDRGAFETYWRERRELTLTLEDIVARGIAQGLFRQVDAYLCSLTIIAQNESVQNWFWRTPRKSGKSAPDDPNAARYRGDEIAEFVATQTVSGLVAAPSRVEQIRRRAKADEKG
ncbi:MAG TPA: TetR/AcrR family transcriptional regulator, partial [Polyangiales bacterium]